MISLILAIVSAIIIALDLYKNPQSMKIMNVVWILTALWGSIFGLVVYYWFGREKKMEETKAMNMPVRPKWQSVTLSTLHCGAGCTLADIIGSLFLIMFLIALIGGWVFTYVLALIIGVYFQFAAIKEMNNLPTSTIIRKAIKADFLSLTAWQVGMYCWMYLLIFHFKCIEPHTTLTWDYWFAMQQAMLAGFILALPMNYLLVKAGIKGGM
ncbi:MAG: DUF4396 domain-containing protein [Rikenellaceae bacterium]